MRYSSFKWEVGSRKWEVKILLLTSYFLLLTFCFSACAPRVALPPPQYKDLDLTLKEIIEAVRKDVDALKVIAGIDIEKDSKPHSYIDAVILLKKPDWLHVRLYKFGVLAGEFLVTEDGRLKIENTLSGGSSKLDGRLRELSQVVYQSFFWWEGLKISDCRFQAGELEYVISCLSADRKTEDREIYLDKTTLLLKRQEIVTSDKRISILYEEPKLVPANASIEGRKQGMEGDFGYASLMRIHSGSYRVSLRIEKLFINPPLPDNNQ